MKFINEVVNGVTIILFVVTNLVGVPKKRNLSTFRGLKGTWKHIRIVALSFSTLCLRISQFYFSMGAGKGYNSAVECHLDVVEVISSSLIIPKPNGSFSILTCSPAVIE